MTARLLALPDRPLGFLLDRGMGPGKNFAGSAGATVMWRGPPNRHARHTQQLQFPCNRRQGTPVHGSRRGTLTRRP
jgi:hypothetical protein